MFIFIYIISLELYPQRIAAKMFFFLSLQEHQIVLYIHLLHI